MPGSWAAGPSSWQQDGQIPLIIQSDLKIDQRAGAMDRVKQGYADVFNKMHQTSDFKRDLVLGNIQVAQGKLSNNANLTDSQKRIPLDVMADTAINLLTRWANTFIESLNEATKLNRQQGGGKGENDDPSADGSDANPFDRISKISLEDFKAVSDFLQYADTYSLEDAAEAAHFDD